MAETYKPLIAKAQKAAKPSKHSKGKREPRVIDFYDEYLGDDDDFYIDTYVDPFDLILAARAGEEDSNTKRVKLENQRIVSYLVMTPSRSIDLSEIKDIAKKIHIESITFDPKVLLKHFYSDITKE